MTRVHSKCFFQTLARLTVELNSFTTYATLNLGWNSKYLGPSGLPVLIPLGNTFNSHATFPASLSYQNSRMRSLPRSGTYATHPSKGSRTYFTTQKREENNETMCVRDKIQFLASTSSEQIQLTKACECGSTCLCAIVLSSLLL